MAGVVLSDVRVCLAVPRRAPRPRVVTARKMAAHHDPEIEKIMKEIPNEISPSELEYGAKIGQGQYGTC